MCENMRYQIKQRGWGNEGMRDEFSQGEEVINVWEWGNERARKIKSHCEGIQYLEYKDRALFGHTHKDFFISLQKAKHCKVFGSPLRRGTPQRCSFVSGYNITVLVYVHGASFCWSNAYQHLLPRISAARIKGTGLEMASDIYRGEVAVHEKIWWGKSKSFWDSDDVAATFLDRTSVSLPWSKALA